MTSHVDVAAPASHAEPRSWLLALSLGVVAGAVMASSLGGPFLFDDIPLIHGNDRVHDFSHWQQWFQSTLWDTNYDPSELRHTRGFWRPVVLLSYALDWRWGRGEPLAFHVTNVALHAINAMLLFRLLRGWLASGTTASLGALLFAVHPVQTESAAWIAGRTDSLCLLGMLLAVLGLRHLRQQRASGSALVALGLVIAYGSKEAAVVFPILAAIEAWHRDKSSLSWGTFKALLRAAAPFAILALGFFGVHSALVPGSTSLHPLTFANRLLLPLEALGRYAALIFFPDDLALGRATIPIVDGARTADRGYAALGAATALGLLLGAWRARRSQPALALALLSFAGMLLPVLTIGWRAYDVNASPRFLYIPMVAVALAAGAMLQTRFGMKGRVRAGFVVLAALFGARAFARAADYSDEERFWAREIASNERYMSAQQYVITRELRARRPGVALSLAHRWFADPIGSAFGKAALVVNTTAAALDLTPDVDTESITRLHRFASALSASQPAELTLPRFGLDLRLPPGSALLGLARIERRQYLLFAANAASRLGDDAAAVRDIDAALEGCAECWTILRTSGLILARAGQLERAHELLERAQRFGPYEQTGEDIFASFRDAVRWRKADGADPIIREVGFYSALGAFGRAYRAARPTMDQPVLEAQSIPALAELAALAGDMNRARSLLLRAYSDTETDARLREYAERVPWRDRAQLDEREPH